MKKLLLTIFCCFALANLTMTVYAQRPQSGHRSHHPEAQMPPRSHHHHHHQNVMTVMTATEEQVDAILTHLKSINFESDRNKAAKLCVTICPVAAEDMAKMLKCFSFEDEKKSFATYAFDYCPDPENYARVMDQLSFDNSKKEVANAIAEKFPMYAREIARIAAIFSFENDRLAFAKSAYPLCLDKEAYDEVINTLSFQNSKNQLRDFMKQVDRQNN